MSSLPEFPQSLAHTRTTTPYPVGLGQPWSWESRRCRIGLAGHAGNQGPLFRIITSPGQGLLHFETQTPEDKYHLCCRVAMWYVFSPPFAKVHSVDLILAEGPCQQEQNVLEGEQAVVTPVLSQILLDAALTLPFAPRAPLLSL